MGDRLDVVAHMHGLGTFAEEFPNTIEVVVDGIPLRVLTHDQQPSTATRTALVYVAGA